MNPLSYYNRSKMPWTEDESTQVRKEYETDLLTIIQMADIHKRTPGCISYKLKSLGLIIHNALARGYAEYKTSQLYQEVCLSCKKEDKEKEKRKEEQLKAKEGQKENAKKANEIVKELEKDMEEDSISIKVPKRMVAIMLELESMKNEIKELKTDVKQMLHYITSLYDFETAQ